MQFFCKQTYLHIFRFAFVAGLCFSLTFIGFPFLHAFHFASDSIVGLILIQDLFAGIGLNVDNEKPTICLNAALRELCSTAYQGWRIFLWNFSRNLKIFLEFS